MGGCYSVAPEHGPRIAAVGGGTGLSTLLRGLKLYTKNLTAIVTVADDGGGSGRLRQDLGMPPPGAGHHRPGAAGDHGGRAAGGHL